jgi:hypothetical protein
MLFAVQRIGCSEQRQLAHSETNGLFYARARMRKRTFGA